MKLLASKSGLFLLAASTGILLSIAWPSAGFAPLLFVALVPLLVAEHFASLVEKTKGKWFVFFISYFAFFTFNLLTTWWVKFASMFGAVAAVICNSLFMAIVFLLFHVTKKKLGNKLGYFSLVIYWVAFEYMHMNWDLSWPWLSLGNGFAGWVKLIQWYEFTGILGGTVWIWLINILLMHSLVALIKLDPRFIQKKNLILISALLLLPVGWSVYRYYSYHEKINPVHVAVIQPNIDPYNEKFSGMSSADQLSRIIKLAATVVDSSTDYLVAPETSLPDAVWEDDLKEHPHVRRLMEFIEPYPNTSWVIGAITNSFYPDSNLRSATARKFTQQEGYYDSYNTALYLQKNRDIEFHHKSKLVPGVEKMPFPSIFKYIENFAIDLGGMSGSLGVQDTPSVFVNENRKVAIAPVICYESIYGDYLSMYARQSANIIFIITNDGWWRDTPGYRQHLKYATLRAIELRRSIARSANTGISCFINQRGDILQATNWWVPDAIKATLNTNEEQTFYSIYGDYLGVLSIWSGCFFLASLLIPRRLL